jgi:maltooligosyltrehalose trehalohydrolase
MSRAARSARAAATRAWTMERGAAVVPGGVRFRVWAPFAQAASVVIGDASAAVEIPMERCDAGVMEAFVAGAGSGTRYRFRLDGADALADPASRSQPDGVHGPSCVVDPNRFAWTDAAWPGVRLQDLVFHELHVGTFTAAGTFDGVAGRLEYLRDLGITALELMPVAEFPGDRNWGYDGVHLFAPQSTYGGPEGLRRLVDAAHAAGLAVFLDVVYNHFGPEGATIGRYGPFFTDRYRTPWGDAIDFDGDHAEQVRQFFVDNALYWIHEYHIDGLRLDAVHAIHDASPVHFLEELAASLHQRTATLGREVHVVAESDLNDARLVRAPAAGGFGLDAQWNDDFHHALHVRLTGEQAGYYVDYAGSDALSKAIRDRFVLAGGYSEFRQRSHGSDATDVPGEQFVGFAQNHDQVGNRARGERLSVLVDFEKLKLAAAITLQSPFLPLLFMGEEYGETRPFQYFVSHSEPDLIEAVREGRRREFESFAWSGEVPDPQGTATFERSRLSWDMADGRRTALHGLYRELLGLRRAMPALKPGNAGIEVTDGPQHIIIRRRTRSDDELVSIFRFDGAAPVEVPGTTGDSWSLVLSTAEKRFQGDGRAPRILPAGKTSLLPPWSGSLYVRRTE